MQKTKALSSILLLGFCILSAQELEPVKEHKKISVALSSGVVIKLGDFAGIATVCLADILTADFCYQPWKDQGGMGLKVSYWKDGKSSYWTAYEELLLTAYLRAIKNPHNWPSMQLYWSVGGGLSFRNWSDFGDSLDFFPFTDHYPSRYNNYNIKFIGELEIGWKYQLFDHISFTNAVRYVFPFSGNNRWCSAGGTDIRVGLGFDF